MMMSLEKIPFPRSAYRYSSKDYKGSGLTGKASAAYKARHLHPFKFWLDVPEHLVPEKLKRKVSG